MADEPNSDATDQTAQGAGAAADDSSDTAITAQLERERSEHASPGNEDTGGAGDSQDTGKQAEEVDSKAADTEKSKIKSRTAKRFGELTDQLRDEKGKAAQLETAKQKAEEKARSLEEENKTFRARMLQQVDDVALPAQPAASPTRTPEGLALPQAAPPTPDSLRAEVGALYQQYQQAKTDGDEVRAAQIAQQYNAKQSQSERVNRDSLLQEFEQRQVQKTQAKRFWNKLMDVHESHPIFERDKQTGGLTANLDWNAPLMKKAVQIAGSDGANQQMFLGNLLYYLKEAQLDLIKADRATDSATLTRTRTHAQQLAGRTGLEAGGHATESERNGKSLEGMSDEQLSLAASRQARGR